MFQGIHADLAVGVVIDGRGFADSVSGIEGIGGSRLAGILEGEARANQLYGDNGNDTLSGGGGADGLTGCARREQSGAAPVARQSPIPDTPRFAALDTADHGTGQRHRGQ